MNDAIDVLIVEDSPTQALELQHALEGEGYRTALAKNGREGLVFLKGCKAKVVLSDINMPEMGGYEFCKILKEDPDLKDTPVILMTNLVDSMDIIRGLECGASNFFTKPVDNLQLVSRIRYIFANHAVRKGSIAQVTLEFLFMGKTYRLDADRMQILDLLLSTYETAVQKNVELIRTQKELEIRIQEREKAERLFNEIVEFSPTAMVVVDRDGKIVLVNAQAEKLFLYARQELLGKPFEMLMPMPFRKDHPNYVARFVARPQTRPAGARSDLFGLSKDGKEIPIEIGLSPIDTSAGPLSLAAIVDLTDRKALEQGLEALVNKRTAELANANEELRREMKEKSDLEARLIHSQKMDAVGRLSGGVAHDFNNILTAINGYAHFLIMGFAPGDPKRADAEEIKKAGERAAGLTRQLLAFSRQQVLQPKIIELNTLIRNINNMLRRIIGEHLTLVPRLAEDLGRIKVDPGQIEQVILNLVVNARDAMPGGGNITIETANVDLTEASVSTPSDILREPHVMLSVGDTGTGMDEKTQARLFEPFFTTKEQGKGTGLGLATVYGIVKQSGGQIAVTSEPGKGSTFKIYLPRAAPDAREGESFTPKPSEMSLGGETILIVEDDDVVRKFSVRLLSQQGYTVLEAANGQKALELSQKRRDPIHLLLTDLVMPGVRGDDLAEIISKLRPDMKIIFTSGYTNAGLVRQSALHSQALFLQKPVEPTTLLSAVREIFNSSDKKSP